jgi:hypothetical protein
VEVHPYFWHTRKVKHSLVTYEVAAGVAKGRRSWPHLDDETGRTVIWGYSPKIGLWVRVILLADGRLFNAFWEDREAAKEAIRRISRGGRR